MTILFRLLEIESAKLECTALLGDRCGAVNSSCMVSDNTVLRIGTALDIYILTTEEMVS